MTRRLWMAASLLAAAATAWLYLGFGPDHLLWAWSRLMPPAAALPAAVPAARLADALLAGVVVAYLTGFVPLTIATWMQGAHLTSLARAAAAASSAGADEVAAARVAMLRSEAERSSPWQLLLQLDLVGVDGPTGAVPQRRANIERAAIVGDLISHQSAASLFRGLAWICLCLGMFALVAQTISDLLGTDLLQRPAKGLELAATRGLLSAVTSIIIAALIDLGSRLAAAAIRQRADSLGRRFDRLSHSRREATDWDRDPVLTAEPIATLDVPRPTGRDDNGDRAAAMIEKSHQQLAQRVDDALQNLAGTTLRPILQEVSGVLSVISSQAGNMVETVDRRLLEQRDDARQIAESAAAARDEIARQTAVMLERSQQQIAQGLDGALHGLADATLRPVLQEVSGLLAVLGNQAGTAIETLDRRLAQQHEDARQLAEAAAGGREEIARQTAAMLERSQQQIAERIDGALQSLGEGTLRPMLQEISGLLAGLGDQAGTAIDSLERRLAQQQADARQLVEMGAPGNGEVARQTAIMLERSQQEIAERVDGALQSLGEGTLRPMLQEISGLLAGLGDQAGTAIDSLERRLARQQADARQLAEMPPGNGEVARQTAIMLERSQQQIAERVDGALQSLAGTTVRPMLQEVSRLLDVLSGQAGALVDTLDKRLAEQREDSRQFGEAAVVGNQQLAAMLGELQQAVNHSTATLEQRLDRLIASQQLIASAPPAPVASSLPQSSIVVRPPAAAEQDALSMLSRFLRDAGRGGTESPASGPAQDAPHGGNDWSDRLADLRRNTADLTNGLPELRPDGTK